MIIIFTAAGEGTRFNGECKPFYKIKGKTLLEWSGESLGLEGDYWIVGSQKWPSKYNLYDIEWVRKKPCGSILIPPTSGQAESAYILASLWRERYPEEPLLITNCDQYTPWDYEKFQNFVDNSDLDGIVSTYKHSDVIVGQPSRYSHIQIENGVGVELAEKFAISEYSLNGIFYFKRLGDFVDASEKLINSEGPGESYMSLVYNYLISEGKRVGIYEMQEYEFVSLGSLNEIEQNLHRLP